MRASALRGIGLLASMALAVGGVGSPAMAAESSDTAKGAATYAREVADRVAPPDSAVPGGVPLEIRLPDDVSSPVEIGPSASPVKMDLPDVGARRLYKIDDDMGVRDGKHTDIVLRRAASAAQVMTVLSDPSAPTSYRYQFHDAQLLQLDGGPGGSLPRRRFTHCFQLVCNCEHALGRGRQRAEPADVV